MPSDDDTTPSGSRRGQRSRRRRIWRRSLVAGVAVALLAAGTAYAVTGPLQDDHGRRGGASRAGPTGAPAPGAAPAQTCRTPLTPGEPLRLWIGGDSLAGSLGPSLGQRTGSSGVVQPVFDSRVSSGLLSADFVNWPQHGAGDMSLYDPEVTVLIVGANDGEHVPGGSRADPK